MYSETLELTRGYVATIANDDSPENPFDAWDCQPPIAVLNWERYHAKLENYKGDELTLHNLLSYIPTEKWTSRAGKREILAALPFPMEEIREEMRWGTYSPCFKDAIDSLVYSLAPSDWSEWIEYFDAMQALAAIAGIPCHLTQSNGYSQGDSALVFTAALPEWVESMKIDAERAKGICESAADLWSAWAWGDVYGVSEIISPDGEEVDDASCWGFYGDHKTSGLMEHCESAINHHIKYLAKEAQESHAAACMDIATV